MNLSTEDQPLHSSDRNTQKSTRPTSIQTSFLQNYAQQEQQKHQQHQQHQFQPQHYVQQNHLEYQYLQQQQQLSSTPLPSSTTPSHQYTQVQDLAHQQILQAFWNNTLLSLENSTPDFKVHPLPLARIKKVMKTEQDMKHLMISSEAPLVFSKACEIFIEELTLRSWMHSEQGKRRTLQKCDLAQAVSKSDMYDFLIDIVPRDMDALKSKKSNEYAFGEMNVNGNVHFENVLHSASTASVMQSASTESPMGYMQSASTRTALQSGYIDSATTATPMQRGYIDSATTATPMQRGYIDSATTATPMQRGDVESHLNSPITITPSSTLMDANVYVEGYIYPT